MNASNGELAAGISVAGVSTIACIVSLEVFLYYKMWHSFIYRLVLYMFMSLIVFNMSEIIFFSIQLMFHSTTFGNTGFFVTGIIITNGSLMIVFMLITSITVCIYLMALQNYQFTYKSDLCLLISCVVYLTIVVVFIIIYLGNFNTSLGLQIAYVTVLFLTIPINIIFTTLTLVPLCCRACGYNLCMKTAATIESHRKALREILPLYVLIVPYFLFFVLWILLTVSINVFSYSVVLYGLLGVLSAFSFSFHFL